MIISSVFNHHVVICSAEDGYFQTSMNVLKLQIWIKVCKTFSRNKV